MAGRVNKVNPESDLARMYLDAGMSTTDVAAVMGVTVSVARRMLLADSVKLRSRAEGVRLAAPKLSALRTGKARHFTPEWCANLSKARLEHSAKHAAGVSVKPNGYIEHTTGANKGRSVHNTLVEARIGRRMRPNEVVHHIDGDRANNSIENLALMTRAAHTRLHRQEQVGRHHEAGEPHGIS